MTDVPTSPDGLFTLSQAPQTQSPHVRILAQFTRDFSFENPLAPESLRNPAQPQIDMGVEMSAKGRGDGLFEVDLKLSVKATRGEETSFQVELVYGGLFEIAGVPEEHLEPVLLVECPRFLFPFARRIVSEATSDGGFPPLLLEPIDFAAVYAGQRAQRETLSETPPLGTA